MLKLKNLVGDKRGIAAVELGLVLGLISLAVMGGVSELGNMTKNSFNDTTAKLAAANG